MPNITETLRKAAEGLRQAGIPDSRREARSLLAFALEKNGTFLFTHPGYELTAAEEDRFYGFLQRRAKREPFQHITGKQEFCGLDFEVSKHVLVPRPETELLAEESIRILTKIDNPRFCEVGVGSGCVAISILHFVKKAAGIGLEISEQAIEIAAKNARANDVSERLQLLASDLFSALLTEGSKPGRIDRFDLIVSNPPYIPEKEIAGLQFEVREFDPIVALTDGKDGLSIIRRIVEQSPDFLIPGGYLLLEIGFDQSDRVRRMFPANIWGSIEFLPDLQGFPRIVRARMDGNLEIVTH